MLDPDCLRAFLAVSDHGHFARAADVLGIAQSVVSKRLQRLEDQLGTRLVERGGRNRIRLARSGELFLPAARGAISALEQAERRGRKIALGEAGPVRIGHVFSAVITGVLQRMVRALHTALPGIEIASAALETPEQLAALATGKLDFGVIRPRPVYPAGVIARRIHRERVVLAIASDHPLAGQATVRVRDLAEARFIVPQFHEEVGLIDLVRDLARAGDFAMPQIVRTADFYTAAGLAASGVGLAAVPASLERLDLEGLCYREFADHHAWLDLMLAYRDDAPAGALAALLDP